MGKCCYCGHDAGLFHSKHDECERQHNQGLAAIRQIVANCFTAKEDFYLKGGEMKRVAEASFIDLNSLKKVYISEFDNAIERYLDDGIIDVEEERTVARFIQYSGLSQAELNVNKSLEKVLQSKVLQDILAGNVPAPRITIGGDFPFMLGKTEHIVGLYRNITLHQQKVKKEHVGGSRGVCVRIMKGVYYRTGGFKGHTVETSYMQRIGVGSMCMTDKNLLFSCPEKSLKIPYTKILSVETFSNGISIQKDGANDKPIFLEGVNGWFAYNVIANLK